MLDNSNAEEAGNNYSLCYDTLLELRKDSHSVIDQNDFAFAASYLYKNTQYCQTLIRLSAEERKKLILSQIKTRHSSQQQQHRQIPTAGNCQRVEELLFTLNNNPI